MLRTAQEIADELQIERPAADSLVRFLVAIGQARFRGERPSPTGRGKGAHLYEIDHGAGRAAAEMIAKVEA